MCLVSVQEEQLLGVRRPQAAKHHPNRLRPMTKTERAQFRAELDAKRESIVAEKRTELQARIKVCFFSFHV